MPGERLSMRKIREVLRLRLGHGLPQRAIAQSLRLSQGAMSGYLSRARLSGLSWPLPDDLDDERLEALHEPVHYAERDLRRHAEVADEQHHRIQRHLRNGAEPGEDRLGHVRGEPLQSQDRAEPEPECPMQGNHRPVGGGLLPAKRNPPSKDLRPGSPSPPGQEPIPQRLNIIASIG
jgi:hypothetical protein